MMERVDRRLVFKPLGNRPFLDGETEPCINGRILGVGSCFKEPNDGLAPLNLLHRERVQVEMETRVGGASWWNTLRALRVLLWYNNSAR